MSFAAVRQYAALSEAALDALSERVVDIESLLGDVPGCTGWLLIRTRDGLLIAIVGDEERALAEAGRRFVAWARRHVPTFRAAALPAVWAGEALHSAGGHGHGTLVESDILNES